MKVTDKITITNEDNMQLMARYPDNYFDLAIVDPPYGIGANKMTLGNGKRKVYRGEDDWGFELVACELDKGYFDASIKRFKQQTAQQRLF